MTNFNIIKAAGVAALITTLTIGSASAGPGGKAALGVGGLVGGTAAVATITKGKTITILGKTLIQGGNNAFLAKAGAVAGGAAIGALIFYGIYKVGTALPGGDKS